MKRRFLFLILCITVLFCLTCVVTACDTDEEIPVEYWTVTIDLNDGSTPTTKDVVKGAKLTDVSQPTREGYTFDGWKVGDEDWTIDTAITADITIVAQWTENTPAVEYWTVTIDLNDGSTPTTKQVVKGEKLTGVSEPTRAGYTFAGWKANDAAWTIDTAITANITIVAQWTENQEPVKEYWTVTIDLNDGSTPTTKQVVKGEKLTGVSEPTRAGYTFAGWKANDAAWTMDIAITANITIVAHWTENTYSISYNMHEHGTAPEKVTDVKALPAELPTVDAVDGWRFDGWYLDAEYNTAATAGAAITSDVTLHAKWTQVFEVTFDLRGRVGSVENLTDVSNLPNTLPSPTASGLHFDGWFLDKNFETAAQAGAALTKNTTLYAKWSVLSGYEDVTYTLVVEELEAGSSTDRVVGKFTICNGTNIRTRTKTWTDPETNKTVEWTKSIQLSSSSSKVAIDAPGEGKLYIWVQNGSGSAEYQSITLKKPNGSTQNIQYVGTVASSPIVRLEIDVVEGRYEITRTSGTSDIFKLEMVCVLEQAAETGFEIVSNGVVDYIAGQQYDSSKLQLNKVYGNGRTEALDVTDADVVIDDSAFNSNEAGEYTISVKYKDYDAQTFTVKVYQVESIRLGFNATEKIGNSTAGNGVYFNQTVKRVYKLNEVLDCSYLSVTAVTALNGNSKEFLLATTDYEVNSSAFDSSTAGKKTVTVTVKGTSVSASFDVYVVSTAPSVVNDVVQLKVDGAYNGEVGAVVNEFNCFVTIQQALDYLKNLGTSYNSKTKLIILAAGTYNEKIEVTIPNIELRGAGKDVTKIEWNSLYDVPDESGYKQVTDSCATFNVRDTAINMLITDVTISNYWNSLEVFNNDLGAGYPEHRALALLVQADMFVMRNCKLLGYQDTVEFFTGRQLIENTYISGTTDFIFGTNNTTYFKNCQIHSITNGKTDGGYITAFKGCNKGSDDYVTYGAIFDGCRFTADADVVANKNTAIGRCWGAYAAVMVMNSELDGHISTKPFDNASKNQRYVSMNAKPTDSTVKFFEYNNTGAGSIQASIAGVTVLTDAAEAAKYANYAIIFGTQNGKVAYNNAWDPTLTTAVEDTNIYFNFSPAKESPTGTNYTVETTLSLSAATTATLELGGGMTLDATNGNIAYNANSGYTNLKAGAKITFHVEANTTVVITTYPNYHYYTINGVATVLDTFAKYFAEATDVEIISTGDLYLGQIVLRLNQQAPTAVALESIELKNQKTEFTVGDEFAVGDDFKVLATYSDGALIELTVAEYEVNHSVDSSVAGEYEVTVSVGSVNKTYKVTYEEASAETAITKTTTLDFTKDGGYDNSRVDYTKASISRNGDNSAFTGTITFDVKQGAIIWVIPYKNYGHFTIGTLGEEDLTECTAPEKYVATKDCTIAVTGNAGNYIAQIGITYPVSESVTYTFRTDGESENKVTATFNGVHGYTDIFYVDASTGKLAPYAQQWAQFNSTTKIKFVVAAGATVTITCYTTDYTVNDTAATATATTITCDTETEIEIVATGNGYIDTIAISFAE